MKAVLLSLRPKWCELIAQGKKTIEVRKTRPKLQTPFKCYIYSTRGDYFGSARDRRWADAGKSKKVIGEFVCDYIDEFVCDSRAHRKLSELGSCLTEQEIRGYCGGQTLYGWHISDLKIYDKPKELGEFKSVTRCKDWQCYEACSDVCGYAEHNQCKNGMVTKRISCPPQSWYHVEELC